jgi:hypothetical protein
MSWKKAQIEKKRNTNPNPKEMKIKKVEISRSHLRSQIQNGQCGHTKGMAFFVDAIGCLLKDDGQFNHSDFHLTS